MSSSTDNSVTSREPGAARRDKTRWTWSGSSFTVAMLRTGTRRRARRLRKRVSLDGADHLLLDDESDAHYVADILAIVAGR